MTGIALRPSALPSSISSASVSAAGIPRLVN